MWQRSAKRKETKMGLIKAIVGAASGVLADQWKEFFYCDSMDKDVLVVRGQKMIGNRSSNTRGNDNIISNGSGIVVADGQCMMIVDQGKIVEVCAEPGEYTFDTSSEPSIFTGSLEDSIRLTFEAISRRFAYGGDTGKDQRVYYFNTKELMDNKFGTPSPIIFKVVDKNIGLDTEVDIRCSGIYSYKIVDPLLFYANVTGNVEKEFRRSDIETQLKTEFIDALAPALGKLAAKEIRPNDLAAHYEDIKNAMNEMLADKWANERGLKIISIALNPITLTEADAQRIKDAQQVAIYKDPAMAAANQSQAKAEAWKAAGANEGGAMNGFVGLGFATGATGDDTAALYAMAEKQKEQAAMPAMPWTCPKCGEESKGNFCSNCGAEKPAPLKCAFCGFVPEAGAKTPNFCPQCGKPFDKTAQ